MKDEDDQKAVKTDYIERAQDFFATIDMPGLKKKGGRLYLSANKKDYLLLEIDEGTRRVFFYKYDQELKQYLPEESPHEIESDVDLPLDQIIRKNRWSYKLRNATDISKVLDVSLKTKKLVISKKHKIVTKESDQLVIIPHQLYNEVSAELKKANRMAQRYKSSTKNYLTNQLAGTFKGRTVKRTTFSQKEELSFFVHKLNLPTKKNKKDFMRHLSKEDFSAAEQLFTAMVEKEAFDEEFMRRLDDYFIREKLSDIIKLGKGILALKSSKLNTEAAYTVLNKLSPEKSIKQLEGVWQEYFNRYLLYLIFSYRQIFSKIPMKLDMEKKYPDFLGINHYLGVDVIEIKHHLTPVLIWDKSHKNYAFSSDMSKAITQTMNYMDAVRQVRFNKRGIRQKITRTTSEENLYNPRGIIIISSNKHLVKRQKSADYERIKRDFTKLRSCLQGIEILTFDEVIGMAENYLTKIVTQDG